MLKLTYFIKTQIFTMMFRSVISLFSIAAIVSAFTPKGFSSRVAINRPVTGVRSMTSSMDILAGISIALALNNAPVTHMVPINTFPVAALETKQGLYKSYTIEAEDKTKALDSVESTYKTAEQTEESKDKYWAILGVLLFGSFVIPMVQYYWYVAEED